MTPCVRSLIEGSVNRITVTKVEKSTSFGMRGLMCPTFNPGREPH